MTITVAASIETAAHTRYQDPDALICPVCGERAYPEPPRIWDAASGALPEFSHVNGTPLCVVVSLGVEGPADPIALD